LRTNGVGLPIAALLTGGQVHDVKGFEPLMAEPGPKPKVILADKGYDANAIRANLEAEGIAVVIPAKRNRKVQPAIDGNIYALRNRVERCFSKLKHSRRLATRYDKTASSFLGFVLISAIKLWLRHFDDRA
jgi:transposase